MRVTILLGLITAMVFAQPAALRITFTAESPQFEAAASEYAELWTREGERIVDEEVAGQRLALTERIDPRSGDIGQQGHVRFVDRREPADRRAVEELADREELLVDGRRRDVEVLLHTREIGETDVEELDIRLLDE